jgi:hypothetical protein
MFVLPAPDQVQYPSYVVLVVFHPRVHIKTSAVMTMVAADAK